MVCLDLSLCHLMSFIVCFFILLSLFIDILQFLVVVAFDILPEVLVELPSKTVWTRYLPWLLMVYLEILFFFWGGGSF